MEREVRRFRCGLLKARKAPYSSDVKNTLDLPGDVFFILRQAVVSQAVREGLHGDGILLLNSNDPSGRAGGRRMGRVVPAHAGSTLAGKREALADLSCAGRLP
jgi:hypothetical protein